MGERPTDAELDDVVRARLREMNPDVPEAELDEIDRTIFFPSGCC